MSSALSWVGVAAGLVVIVATLNSVLMTMVIPRSTSSSITTVVAVTVPGLARLPGMR